jgi:hypothetical protein
LGLGERCVFEGGAAANFKRGQKRKHTSLLFVAGLAFFQSRFGFFKKERRIFLRFSKTQSGTKRRKGKEKHKS